MGFASVALRAMVRAYQLMLSWLVVGSCRHIPSCSSYAIEAIERHGAIRGSLLSARRLLKCRPGGSYGYDPVPEPSSHNQFDN